MNIETKFKVDDTVYYVKNNRITEDTVTSINIEIGSNIYSVLLSKITYSLERGDKIEESRLHESPEECASNLVKNVYKGEQ